MDDGTLVILRFVSRHRRSIRTAIPGAPLCSKLFSKSKSRSSSAMALGRIAGPPVWSRVVVVPLGHVLGLTPRVPKERLAGPFPVSDQCPPFVCRWEQPTRPRVRKAQVAQVVSPRNVWTKEESGVLL